MNDIMTLEEVAGYLRVSERTVIDWVQKGELPGGKLGTSWRFKRSEIEGWVNKKLTPRIKAATPTGQTLTHLISPQRTVILNCSTKQAALNEVIDLCMSIQALQNRQELADAIFQRETLMSTGIGLSIAVPHARLNSVNDVYMTFAVNKLPLTDYESLDGEPVQIIVMIIAGRDQHAQYIATLSNISKMLKQDVVRGRLLSAATNDELYNILIEEAESI
ncbi:PTS sugar transporter subunit IIA [candidate division KSB1 bacterium]|nr:PTS sugar transporter subunit IIA [candidate division KSB1 bacterium]